MCFDKLSTTLRQAQDERTSFLNPDPLVLSLSKDLREVPA